MIEDQLPLSDTTSQAPTAAFPVTCWCGCQEQTVVTVNLLTGKHTAAPATKPPGYGARLAVLEFYKTLKGFDAISSWDGSFRARGLKTAGQILHFFRRHKDPVSLARELIEDTGRALESRNLEWKLETCYSRAAEWLAGKRR